MKITINKIAEIAGVSRSAVDKVIHGRPGVKESVRQRVLQVIAETGYVPLHKKAEPAHAAKTVAVVIPKLTNTNPYFSVLKQGMDAMCSAYSEITLQYHHCDTTDIEGMAAVLESLKESGIHAFLIRGVRSERIREIVNRLKVPVVFIACEVPGAKRLCTVGEDCYKSGRMAASLLAKSIDYQGDVALLTGSFEITEHKRRMEGFIDAVRERYPKMHIVRQIFTQDQSVMAYEKTSQLLKQCAQLRGICNLAGHAGEVGQAIMDEGRQNKIKMVCYNTTHDVAALIQNGIVEFSIGLDPHKQGRILVETIYQYLIKGQSPPAEFIKTPFTITFDENMEGFY